MKMNRSKVLLDELAEEFIECPRFDYSAWRYIKSTINHDDPYSLLVCGLAMDRFLKKSKMNSANIKEPKTARTISNRVIDKYNALVNGCNEILKLLSECNPIVDKISEYQLRIANLIQGSHDFVDSEIKRYKSEIKESMSAINGKYNQINAIKSKINKIPKEISRKLSVLPEDQIEISYIVAAERLEKFLDNPIEHKLFTKKYVWRVLDEIYLKLKYK